MEQTHYIVECVWNTWKAYHLIPKEFEFKDLFYRRDKVCYKEKVLNIQSKVYEENSENIGVKVVDDFDKYFKCIYDPYKTIVLNDNIKFKTFSFSPLKRVKT